MADNTIDSLRKHQVGLEAVAAQGTLTMDTQPTANDTVIIGPSGHTITYTWVASGATSGQINVGADLAAAKLNFVAAINGSDSIQDGENPYVSAAAFSGDDCVLTARIPGPFGETITTTETFTASSNVFDAGTLGTTTASSMARGTAVAATTRLAVEMLDWADDDENVYRPKVANGLLMRNRGTPAAVQHGTRFTLPEQAVIWEMLPLWFAGIIDGQPTMTASLGGDATWTFVSDPTTGPNLMAFTLERQFNNGLGDTIDENAAYAMLDGFGLRFAVNDALKIASAKGFARKFATMGGGVTSGLTLPSFEVGVSALSKIYVDNSWATLGNTLLSTQVIGWDLTITPGTFPRYTAEGRTGLDFTKHQINGDNRSLGLTLTCLLDPTTYAAEQAKADAGDLRAVRIAITGPNNRSLNIDMVMTHAKAGLWAPGVDEGADTVTFTLEEATDNTNFFQATLVLPDTYSIA